MSKWVLKGLRAGIKSTFYPDREETAQGVSPGLPGGRKDIGIAASLLIARCPTGALLRQGEQIGVDFRRCVHCYRCLRGIGTPVEWKGGYEWAALMEGKDGAGNLMGKAFHRSLHVRFVDGGACGACLSEVEQLNKPYYNMHRLGFFVTPTPREADILLVAGPVTDNMRLPLKKAFEAMPSPKRVLALGACALSGGVFGPSFASGSGVSEFIPADIGVPGCPPPPLAILHGLLLAVSRKPSASLASPESAGGRKNS